MSSSIAGSSAYCSAMSSASRVMVASGVFSSCATEAAWVARATMPSLRTKRSRSSASWFSRSRSAAASRVENTSTTTLESRKLAAAPHRCRLIESK